MFRFTIRDVLWLTVVVALVLGWVTDRRRFGKSPAQLATLVEILDRQGVRVELRQDRIRLEDKLGRIGLYDWSIDVPLPKTPYGNER